MLYILFKSSSSWGNCAQQASRRNFIGCHHFQNSHP